MVLMGPYVERYRYHRDSFFMGPYLSSIYSL